MKFLSILSTFLLTISAVVSTSTLFDYDNFCDLQYNSELNDKQSGN